MEQERDQSLLSELAAVSAERDRLREALSDAGSVIERLRTSAQAGHQAKADFMARMTHEMRTPLSAIVGLAGLAQPLAGSHKISDYLDKITLSAQGLLEVVDDITDFSRLEKGQVDLTVAPFHLAAALDRVVARLRPAAVAKGVALEVRLDGRVPLGLVGDSARLEGILGHLAGNAVKFTEHGSVRLEVDWLGCDGPTARLGFCVADTGIGMAQASIPAMLESFTQADGSLSRPYGGTGLGLALASRGVALLGSVLAVESTPGQGTRFRFAVNFAEDAVTSTLSCSAPAVAGPDVLARHPLADSLILLVEDNPINQQVARETLERLGAVVAVAANGREAVAMVARRVYDVVLMDVQMPVMDGLAATRAIRSLPGTRALPIVALTAHALAEDRQRCLNAGMNDYLTKPLDVARLLAVLGQWIAAAPLPAREQPAQAATAAATAASAASPASVAATAAGGRAAATGMDVDTALRRLGGNERLLVSVAAEFARDYAGSAATLAALVAAGETDAARRLAHTLKGLAGNLAADALALAANALESSLSAGTQPGAAALADFTKALEQTVASAAALAAARKDAPPQCGDGCWRVLLVDDAKLNRAIFAQILRSAGHEVVTAENGKDACRVLFGEKAVGRPFDLILLDIEMPEMDGPTAARTIRGVLAASVTPPCPPGIPIVALTSHDADAERARCLAAGMDACLHKVFDQGDLLAQLSHIMGAQAGKPRPLAGPRSLGGAGAGLAPLLRAMAGHLAEGSIRADEDMAVVREAFVGRLAPPEVAALSEAVERYEFARALDLLKRLAVGLDLDLTLDLPGQPG
ncbi:response regulator [Desulfovibrio aerotolerans]|uniref:histidine kinase n=1 Tax=Solidesulfovibrio aerotolerans TaxID=295255 RepID=A0A7C9IR15_9BACT|nr:response regulator [Solidesulfovibrio aerotolerans]MYL81607.1 response regulator [Solidesulfovibrio aerotolerans]